MPRKEQQGQFQSRTKTQMSKYEQGNMDDYSLMASPRSNLDLKQDEIVSAEQITNYQDNIILTQSSFASNTEKEQKPAFNKCKRKIQISSSRISLNLDNKGKSNQIRNDIFYDTDRFHLIEDKNFSSSSSSQPNLISQQQQQQQQMIRIKNKALTQSVSYSFKKDNPFTAQYDDKEKKEFFRAIKFNLHQKKRGENKILIGQSSLSYNSNQFKDYLQQMNGGNTKDINSKNIQLLKSNFPFFDYSSPRKNQLLSVADSPSSISQSLKIIPKSGKDLSAQYFNIQPSHNNININEQSQTSLIKKNYSQPYLSPQFLTPQNKHLKDSNKSHLFLSSLDESATCISPHQLYTPSSTKEKKQNERIQKIMNFSLAKEINNLVTKMKKRECNPSILKLPTIKRGSQGTDNDNESKEKDNFLLEYEKQQIQIVNSNSSLQFNQDQQSLLSRNLYYASGSKKKQVHFIIDENQQTFLN